MANCKFSESVIFPLFQSAFATILLICFQACRPQILKILSDLALGKPKAETCITIFLLKFWRRDSRFWKLSIFLLKIGIF